jgi:hypothetical protein
MPQQPWIKRNLDVVLGLLAWAAALSNFFVSYWPGHEQIAFAILVAIPGCWAFCLSLALEHRKRKALYLWWVWPSAPIAFMKWVYFVIEFLLPRGFGK